MSAPRNTTTPSEDDAMLLARGARYRLVGRLLSDPLQAPFTQRSDLETGTAACAYLGDLEGERRIDAIQRSLPSSEEEARAEYTRVFGILVSAEAPPFEVEYEPRTDVFWRASAMADIVGFHRAFGLEIGGHERPDHIAVEADFMWYLLEREVAARSLGHGPEKVGIVASAFRSYFVDHFGKWSPSFAFSLAKLADRLGAAFHSQVADFLAHIATAEAAVMGVPPAIVRPPVVTDAPAPDECEGCTTAMS